MAFFNEFPNTRTYDSDLGWLISAMRKLMSYVDGFEEIKYADPLAWNITHQYEKNTIVKDPESGVLYLSKKPVPSGISLVNDEYWIEIGNFDYQITFIKEAVSALDEGDANFSAHKYLKDEFIWWNDKIYKTTATIEIGDALTPGTNIEAATVGETLSLLLTYRPTNYDYYFYYYVDGVNGDDTNDGLTAATAFKTLDRCFAFPNVDMRIYIESAGTYTSDIQKFSNISLHLVNHNLANDVKVHFNANHNVQFYNCYTHLTGIKFESEPSYHMYFDGGCSNVESCNFLDDIVDFNFCNFSCDTITTQKIDIADANGIIHNIRITNTDNAIGAFRVRQNSNVFVYGSFDVDALSAPAPTDASTIVYVLRATLNMYTAPAVTGSNYYNGINNAGGTLYCTKTRYDLWAAAANNGNVFSSIARLYLNDNPFTTNLAWIETGYEAVGVNIAAGATTTVDVTFSTYLRSGPPNTAIGAAIGANTTGLIVSTTTLNATGATFTVYNASTAQRKLNYLSWIAAHH